MNTIEDIRKGSDGILVAGNHPGIVQSILDFDYLCGKSAPSIIAIVAANRKAQKFFFGAKEILIPCIKSIASVPAADQSRVQWLLSVQSGRRAYDSVAAFFATYPDARGAHIFAENVPEIHATELIRRFGGRYVIAGPSGVGILVPGYLKMGAIGGIGAAQLEHGKLMTPGSIAVISTSGAMDRRYECAT